MILQVHYRSKIQNNHLINVPGMIKAKMRVHRGAVDSVVTTAIRYNNIHY